MLKFRKGQAAMEFLMTYGWAILAAIIVIAVLASFGVFSPSKYVPNKCILSAPLGCVAGTADTAGVDFEVRNGAGETVTITAITVAGCAGTVAPGVGSYAMIDQNVTLFSIPCTLTAGKFKGDIKVSYTKTGSTLTQISTGELVDEV